MSQKISFIGAGAYAESLAQTMAIKHQSTSTNSLDISLWTHRDFAESGMWRYHNGTALPHNVSMTNHAAECIEDTDMIFIATRTSAMESVLSEHFSAFNLQSTPIVSCCKGVAGKSQKLPLDVIRQHMNVDDRKLAVCSGPGYANDIMEGNDAAVVVAGRQNIPERVHALIGTEHLSVVPSDDRIGVQLCAAKNTAAIILGVIERLKGLHSALWDECFQRSLDELQALVVAYGGRKETVNSPAGVGDLFITSTVGHSRNRHFGNGIANGVYDTKGETVEGRDSAAAFTALGKRRGLSLPLLYLVHDLIQQQRDMPRKELESLVEQALEQHANT